MDMKFPIGFLPQIKEKSEEEYKNAFTGAPHKSSNPQGNLIGNMAAFNVQQRDNINSALGVGIGQSHHVNVEVKFGGPDGVILDLSETGWAGTSRHPR